jgi:hypothetical protein
MMTPGARLMNAQTASKMAGITGPKGLSMSMGNSNQFNHLSSSSKNSIFSGNLLGMKLATPAPNVTTMMAGTQ